MSCLCTSCRGTASHTVSLYVVSWRICTCVSLRRVAAHSVFLYVVSDFCACVVFCTSSRPAGPCAHVTFLYAVSRHILRCRVFCGSYLCESCRGPSAHPSISYLCTSGPCARVVFLYVLSNSKHILTGHISVRRVGPLCTSRVHVRRVDAHPHMSYLCPSCRGTSAHVVPYPQLLDHLLGAPPSPQRSRWDRLQIDTSPDD